MNNDLWHLLATVPLLTILAAGATTAPPTQTSLWEVSSAQRTVYIASDTMVLSAEDYPLPKPFTKAFAASSTLYVEQIPPTSKKGQAQLHSLIVKQGMLPENKTLADVLTPTQLATVKAAVEKKATPFSHLDRMRPWLLAAAWIGLPRKPSSHATAAIKPQPQLTQYFDEKAKARNIPVTPFESNTKLFETASSLPMKAQVKWLMLVIKKDDDAKQRKLVKAWRVGNTPAVVALGGSFKDMPKVRQALVVDRNKAWVDILEGKLRRQGKPIFVVVGDGHLMGQDTMLSLLRKDGFQVRQL